MADPTSIQQTPREPATGAGGYLVVYAEASRGRYPGHMVVGQEEEAGEGRYFGFWFDPADLPAGVRDSGNPDRWREYLLSASVPGHIIDETRYVRHLLAVARRPYYEKRARTADEIEATLPPSDRWRAHGAYSLNPDDFHTAERPCYNCVKWAITIARTLVEDFLPHVPNGRVHLIIPYLQERLLSRRGADDGEADR